MVDVVRACQDEGILNSTPPEVMAVAVWGQIHGIISLRLEGQLSHRVLDRFDLRDIVLFALDQTMIIKS